MMLTCIAQDQNIESTGTSDRRQVNFDFTLTTEQVSRLSAQGCVTWSWLLSCFDKPTAL